MTESDELLARARLVLAVRPGDPAVAACIRERGAVGAAEERAGAVPLGEARESVARWRHRGVAIVVPGDPDWPTQLDDLAVPPLLLFRLGSPLRPGLLPSVAVVGARAATTIGRDVARAWAAELAGRGASIVSGGAFGIDRAAHEGALGAGGATVAVLAAGVDVDSPRGNSDLLGRIRRRGCVVSELPPGTAPSREAFLIRNRLIAALTPGTLVVEAAERSGALATARRAAELMRVVMAVPGPAGSPQSRGCHRLVREHEAVLVDRPEDVWEAIAPFAR